MDKGVIVKIFNDYDRHIFIAGFTLFFLENRYILLYFKRSVFSLKDLTGVEPILPKPKFGVITITL